MSSSLADLSDRAVQELVQEAPVVGTGIGGTSRRAQVCDTTVFVKSVPLTDLELRPENVRSTANLFDLPAFCHYGVGSPSFGVWRELAAHVMTTSWVLQHRMEAFPLLYHWRVLAGPAFAGPLVEELADIDGAVEYWHGSTAVRRRIEAIAGSSAAVALFLEHLPAALPVWLGAEVARGPAATAPAVALVDDCLRRDIPFMNRAGLFHFDAHLGNILTDGQRLYLADFGLAVSPDFELTPDEKEFVELNRSHDLCHTITKFTDWLVTNLVGIRDWQERDRFVARCAAGQEVLDEEGLDLEPAAAAIITRYAPVAAVINRFYRSLHLEDRRTPYPAAEVALACATAGLDLP